MSAAAIQTHPRQVQPPEPAQLTLLALVQTVNQVTDDEREVVATIVHLLRTGRVRLCGNFRGMRFDT